MGFISIWLGIRHRDGPFTRPAGWLMLTRE
jgi:hypothetical protein